MSTRLRSRSSSTPSVSGPGSLNSTSGWNEGGHTLPNPVQATTTYAMGTMSETSEDVVTARYLRRVNSGEIINNPMKMTKIEDIKPSPGTISHVCVLPATSDTYCSTHKTKHKNTWKKVGGFRPSPLGGHLDVTVDRESMRNAVKSAALVQAYANIDTSEMLALATAAEGRKTVDSILSILNGVRGVVRDARRFNVSALARRLSPSEMADRYMEFRYALRPLYFDAMNAVAALEKPRGRERRTFRGYAEDSATWTGTALNHGVSEYMLLDWNKSCVYTVSAKAGILCDVEITNAYVFGLSQVMESAWELVPFSFIVDWFANVGELVAAHTPDAGVIQRASWVTVRETLHKTASSVNARSTFATTYPGATTNLSVSPMVFEWKETVLQREIDVVAPWYLGFGMNLDIWKLLDLSLILKRLVGH